MPSIVAVAVIVSSGLTLNPVTFANDSKGKNLDQCL